MTRIPLKNVIFVGHRETGGATLSLLPEYGLVEMVRNLPDGPRTFWFPLRECQQIEPMHTDYPSETPMTLTELRATTSMHTGRMTCTMCGMADARGRKHDCVVADGVNGVNHQAVDATAKNEINVEPTGSTGAPVGGRVRGPRAK